jgi:HTH-type transcriptional regulator/antitoxin HigA
VAVARADGKDRLCKRHPLKSITNDQQLAKAQAVLDELLRRPHLEPNEKDYLDALSDLIELYEANNWPIEAGPARGVISHLMESRAISQQQLSDRTGIPKSTVSEILSGKREINLNTARSLADFFHVPVSVFVD